ncbi:F-box domain-containing protein [Caenorhabditis elegans]|uniref:F-box domain-containing protein n=1 Tax=Caenorhabditis elegans TaxID=6239 RepID=O17200_CAEEL|nr:F-box domain-containing protein [Caenorhabditis elegans]CCD63673.1 F-box domain-containing protein [Caenorhabditis elegans]|eukprot:NP_494014.2 F-box A protein [Caenorhabditis elegans]
MSASLRQSELTIRACILYEALGKNPIQLSYYNFCTRVGNGVMGFSDFEFWYDRFSNGNHDLDYDRSVNQVPKSLPEMPKSEKTEISEIGTQVDIVELLNLMKVSQSVAQKRKVVLDSLVVQFYEGESCSRLIFNDRYIIKYEKKDQGCTVSYSDNRASSDSRKKEINVTDEDYVELCIKDLKLLMENRMVHLKTFRFAIIAVATKEFREKCMKRVEEALKTAKSLTSRTVETTGGYLLELAQLMAIFPAKNVEEIRFTGDGTIGSEQLVSLEQWKNARKFDGMRDLNVPIEHFLHFETFIVYLSVFTEDDAVKLRDMIDRSAHFCYARLHFKSMNIRTLMGVFDVYNTEHNIVYQTPDQRYFNVRFYSNELQITKSGYKFHYY